MKGYWENGAKMNIALFVWEYPPTIAGGLGTYAHNMAPGLVKMGHEVSVFTLNRGGLLTKEAIEWVDVYRPNIPDAGVRWTITWKKPTPCVMKAGSYSGFNRYPKNFQIFGSN